MNVIDLLRKYYEPRKVSAAKGGEYQSACPGCGDGGKGKKSNRFHVWPEANHGEGSYWCRQCGRAGDLIQFLRDFEGFGY
ncbi:MAG: helicase, partial [Thermodesulfobacteriota bacterium]|nr:helicase [Thermodesulfobacteriota bacterium]